MIKCAFYGEAVNITDIAYIFTLPRKTAVHAMSMQYQGKIYKRGKFSRKQEARAKYD